MAEQPNGVKRRALVSIFGTDTRILAAEAKGQVINFWATWCGPCRAELPLLAQAQAQGENVVLINVGESAEQVQAFLQREGLAVNTYLGGEAITGGLQVGAFPTTLAVDMAENITDRHLGPLSAAQLGRLLQAAGTVR